MQDLKEFLAIRKPVIDNFHRLNCSPTVTIDMDVNLEPALQWKQKLSERSGEKQTEVTLDAIIFKATAMALREYILFNYAYNGKYRLIPNERIDLATPLDLDGIPAQIVVPETDRKTVVEIAAEYHQGAEQAKQITRDNPKESPIFGRLPVVSELLHSLGGLARRTLDRFPRWEQHHIERLLRQNGTFTVANVGRHGITACHGQLAMPAIASLLVLAEREDVLVQGGTPRVRKVLPLALEFDHKVADAGFAARFLATIKRNLEEPEIHCADH